MSSILPVQYAANIPIQQDGRLSPVTVHAFLVVQKIDKVDSSSRVSIQISNPNVDLEGFGESSHLNVVYTRFYRQSAPVIDRKIAHLLLSQSLRRIARRNLVAQCPLPSPGGRGREHSLLRRYE